MCILKLGRAGVLPPGGHLKLCGRMDEHKASRSTREDETVEQVQNAVFMHLLVARLFFLPTDSCVIF